MSDNEAKREAKREEIKEETHGVEDEEKDESESYSRGYDAVEQDAISDIEIYYLLLVWSFLLLYTQALTIKIIKSGSHELPLPAK
jgi:hypothetical protein